MAPPLSRIRFAVRGEGEVLDLAGEWYDFETYFGYIEDWSGLLSEGSVGGDIIEQDWVNGAIWQQGSRKTYSFDVPFTSLVTNKINPNILDSYASYSWVRSIQGILLTLRRDILDTAGVVALRHQAHGVLASDIAAKVGIGRVIGGVAVFQNLSGEWLEVSPA